jgi:hypothetical protein
MISDGPNQINLIVFKEEIFMNKLILASLFVTTSVMACPDLKGTYLRCTRGSNDRIQVYIDQIKDADGVTTYSIGEDKYRADGVPEIIRIREPNTGVKIEVVTTAECRGTTSLDIKFLLSKKFVASKKMGNLLFQTSSNRIRNSTKKLSVTINNQ